MEHWIDPVSLAIVLGGTLLATLLRCGFAHTHLALSRVAALARKPFDPAPAKAELARQIRTIENDGILRAERIRSGDRECDALAETLFSRRSVETLRDEHLSQQRERAEASQAATGVLHQAAELSPVLGLAGTLVALGTMPSAGAPSEAVAGGMTGAIAMAVVTTLYGLAAANFLFNPLAAAVERRAVREERDRQDLLDWLADSVARTQAHRPVVREMPAKGADLRIAS